MWLGLSLFYVGAVLCLNGLWMLGRIADRDGDFVADLDVASPGSGADLEIPTDELFAGALVRINTATITEP